ncbi:hypothetical protein [Couchioplanes azureus]|uniref:hypothetical protein n=1 Tax=Couchioplanes caeruleus TaxID=56438 RepID=UPI001670B9C7|nr:hypothetical protein [Couchioplanes caeruleus]
MRNLPTSVRSVLVVVLAVLGLGTVVLAPATAAGAAGTSGMDKLVLTWIEDGRKLQVEGIAYRPKAMVEVRLGDSPLQQARSDENGRVRLTVPEELIAAGQSGASIIVAGRSVSGAARVLISAVPPRAAVRGPADVLPWSIAGIALVGLALGALHRRRSQRRPAAAAARTSAPAGYRSRHALA